MLLFHGSRVTNFAGILSQGLKIAPPSAPVSGYLFGKGNSFIDIYILIYPMKITFDLIFIIHTDSSTSQL